MAIVRIEQIYLYTDQRFEPIIERAVDGSIVSVSHSTDPDTDSAKAIQWLADNGITDYINLNYGDPEVHQACFDPLNTWQFVNKTANISSFPFMYYTEVHDDLPANQMPLVLLYGLEEIQNSNLAELYSLGK